MALEDFIHLFSRDGIKANQASSETNVILSTPTDTFMEPNQRRILRNEVAAKVAEIEKAS